MQSKNSKGRRGNNEGSIYQRKDGRWAAAVTTGGGRASQKRKYVYGQTRQDVAKKLTEVMKTLQDGIPIPSDTITVTGFAREWLVGIKPIVKETTWEEYEGIMRVHVIPSLGPIKLTKLEPRHLERFYAELSEKGLSPVDCTELSSPRPYHA